MKKNNLLKALAVIFGIYVLLTWFIPTGYFSSGEFMKSDITPIGLFDIIRYPLITLTSSVFVLTGLVVLAIGGLYGVMNKTGVYQKYVDSIVKKFKGKETSFLIITVITFVLLSSLTALSLPLLILVPFFSTVLLLLGVNKMTAMIATIGAILGGNIASTYGFNVAGYITYFTDSIHTLIGYRILLLVAVIGLLLLTVFQTKKGKEKVKKEDILLYEKKEQQKETAKPTALIVISCIMIVLLVVGMFNWEEIFGWTFFSDLYTNITEFKLNGYPIATNIIGAMYQIGQWTNYELVLVIAISATIIGFAYKMKFTDIVAAFIDGMKKILPVAIYAVLANVLLLVMNATSTGYTIFPTIANWLFGLADGFNTIIYAIITFIGSILYNDFPYLLGSIYDPITNLYTENVSIIGMISQTVHGLVQFIAPTSVLLVIGLTYFDIPYIEWIKKVFKFILFVLLIIIVIIILISVL